MPYVYTQDCAFLDIAGVNPLYAALLDPTTLKPTRNNFFFNPLPKMKTLKGVYCNCVVKTNQIYIDHAQRKYPFRVISVSVW